MVVGAEEKNAERETSGLGYLSADTQPLDQSLIPLNIPTLEIIQKPSPFSDKPEQAHPRVMVLFVSSQMLCQVNDAVAVNGNLHLGRTGVGIVESEFLDRLACLLLS